MADFPLPSPEAFNGPDGSERLHQTLDELLKTIPDGLSASLSELQANVATLTEQNTSLQSQLDIISAAGTPKIFREENVGLNVTLGREIIHNLGTTKTVVSVEVGPADSNKSWIVSEKVSFPTNENQLSIYFDVAPVLNFDVTIIGFV